MSADAHSTMMKLFMGRVSANLQTSLHISVTREGPGGVRAHLEIHTRTCRSCVGKYYSFIVVRDWRPPLDEIEIDPKSMIACVCICMTSYIVGPLTEYFSKARRTCTEDDSIASIDCGMCIE